jgi:hypothetical protein
MLSQKLRRWLSKNFAAAVGAKTPILLEHGTTVAEN